MESKIRYTVFKYICALFTMFFTFFTLLFFLDLFIGETVSVDGSIALGLLCLTCSALSFMGYVQCRDKLDLL